MINLFDMPGSLLPSIPARLRLVWLMCRFDPDAVIAAHLERRRLRHNHRPRFNAVCHRCPGADGSLGRKIPA